MQPVILVARYCRSSHNQHRQYHSHERIPVGVGAHCTFLFDAGRVIQKDLDIAEYMDPDYNPMIPYDIVLEPGLIVYKIYNGYWFFGRPTLKDLRQDLRSLTQECRPDWTSRRRK